MIKIVDKAPTKKFLRDYWPQAKAGDAFRLDASKNVILIKVHNVEECVKLAPENSTDPIQIDVVRYFMTSVVEPVDLEMHIIPREMV